MATGRSYLAVDLGASSGRAILGTIRDSALSLQEIHRFENAPVRILNHLHWNLPGIFGEILTSLQRCHAGCTPLAGIGIDTWGVDYGLLSESGELLGLPYAYRDPRTEGAMEQVFQRVSREALYSSTGIQFMPFNSLFQLFVSMNEVDRLPERAARLLFLPDLLNYWLTGLQQSEYSIASTSQMLCATTRDWGHDMVESVGIPSRILPPIVSPGTVLGPLHDSITNANGLPPVPVIAPGCHDTASAVAAVPASGDDWAYISSGTWSLIGVELTSPLTGADVLAANFTNEGGVQNTIRFLKNVAGLWLAQECLRKWNEDDSSLTHADLVVEAATAPSLQCLIDPDDPGFLVPGNMPARLHEYLIESGQHVPGNRGGLIRCILESLALRYRSVVEKLEELTGRSIRKIYIVGGGVKNELLNQLTADATGRPVITGPAEATAIGNIMVQAIGCGDVGSLSEARAIIAHSTPMREYLPVQNGAWDEAYARFQVISARNEV